MQLGSVSRKFQAAARTVLTRRLAKLPLELGSASCYPARMDSKQLLAWADCVLRMYVDSRGCAVAGMPAFIRAAGRLRELHVDCESLLACSQADAFLAGSPNLQMLVCSGWFNPHYIPNSVVELHCDPAFWAGLTQPSSPVEALLWRLASVTSLRALHLDLASVHVALDLSGIQLPALSCLKLSMRSSDELPAHRVHLSWLQGQPVEQLYLVLTVASGEAEHHARLIGELRQLSVHTLSLRLNTAIVPDVQRQWASLAGLHEFNLVACKSMTLVALPQCKRRTVRLANTAGNVLSIEWAALTCCSGAVRLSSAGIEILHCSGHVPRYAEPWQLRSFSFFKVKGLTAPLIKRKHDHLLQNAAADAAGW